MFPYPMTSPGLAGGMVGGTSLFSNGSAALPALIASQQALLPPGLTAMPAYGAIPGFAGLNGVAPGHVAAMRGPVAGAYAGNPTPPVSPQNVPVFAAAGFDCGYDGR